MACAVDRCDCRSFSSGRWHLPRPVAHEACWSPHSILRDPVLCVHLGRFPTLERPPPRCSAFAHLETGSSVLSWAEKADLILCECLGLSRLLCFPPYSPSLTGHDCRLLRRSAEHGRVSTEEAGAGRRRDGRHGRLQRCRRVAKQQHAGVRAAAIRRLASTQNYVAQYQPTPWTSGAPQGKVEGRVIK